MDPARLRKILEGVRRGRMSTREALESLARLPFETVGPATVDHHRSLRQHLPEVILCEGKTVLQCVAIARAIARRSGRCLATRASRAQAEALVQEFGNGAVWNDVARTVVIADGGRPKRVGRRASAAGTKGRSKAGKGGKPGSVLVVSAGTSDLPVAEEAVVTLEFMGVPVSRVYDAGVAGIHRLLAHVRALRSAS